MGGHNISISIACPREACYINSNQFDFILPRVGEATLGGSRLKFGKKNAYLSRQFLRRAAILKLFGTRRVSEIPEDFRNLQLGPVDRA